MNIDEMPAGTELDVLIAEALGYVRILVGAAKKNPPGAETFVFTVADKVPSFADGVYIRHVSGGDFRRFAPSTDIAAAWEVVRTLNQRGYTLRLAGPEIPDTTGYFIEESWGAAFVEPQYAFTDVGQNQGRGSTPSLAICRAALKVMAEGQK
jgi:hypothetical protein